MLTSTNKYSEIISLGKTSSVPMYFTSLLSQLFNLKESFIRSDEKYNVTERTLDDAVIFCIFQRQFEDSRISHIVVSYCVAVSTIKVQKEIEVQLHDAKSELEKKKKKFGSIQPDWLKFMPYPDDEKVDREVQSAYQTLMELEISFDQLTKIAKRAFNNLQKHLDLLKDHDYTLYEKSFDEIAWSETYFSDDNNLQRIKLLIQD